MAAVKRTNIQRRTPLLPTAKSLQRITALGAQPLSRSAVHAQSAANRRQPKAERRTRTAVPARVRAALAVRSGGLCEIAAHGCTGAASEASHRIKRGMGGRKGVTAAAHDVLSNLLHTCHHCHHVRGHRSPTEAYLSGWMLREYLTPTAEPCFYRGRWVWLTDDGLVLNTNPAEEVS